MRKPSFSIVIAHTTHDLNGLGATLRVLAGQLPALSGMGVSPHLWVVNASDDTRLKSFVGSVSRRTKVVVSACSVTELKTLSKAHQGFAIILGGDLPGKAMLSLCIKGFIDSNNSKYLAVRPGVEYHFFEQDFNYYSDLGRPSWSTKSHFRTFDHDTEALTSCGLTSIVDFWSGTVVISHHALSEHLDRLSKSGGSNSSRSAWIRAFSIQQFRQEYVEGAFIAVRH